MTVWRVLRKAGMKKTKPTRKPGLTKKMKEERLVFCRSHQHWTLEDGRMLFGQMKPLLFYYIEQVDMNLAFFKGGFTQKLYSREMERLFRVYVLGLLLI